MTYLPTGAAITQVDSAPTTEGKRTAVFAPLPDSLPGTVREARAIARLLSGAEIFLGARGNEQKVRRMLEEGRPVHVASHGLSNAQNPLFSRIFVGRGGGVGSEADGRLEVHEILRLRTASPLVFLSGCETGLGARDQEAFGSSSRDASLAQAFLVAGVRNVVATLWRVGDTKAAALAEAFYRHLRLGLPPADALAQAQREAIQRGGDLTWAAYAVFGSRGRKSGNPVRVTGTEP